MFFHKLVRMQNMVHPFVKFSSLHKVKHVTSVPACYFYSTLNSPWSSWTTSVASSQPVLWAQDGLEYVHIATGLPWWISIIVTTVGMRACITFPLTVYQNIMMAKYENMHSELKDIALELRKETAIAKRMYGWDEKTARYMFNRSMRKQTTKLIVRDNCHPMKSSVSVLIQLPMWISISFALRNMVFMFPIKDAAAEIVFLELSFGGALWFPNLTVPDASLAVLLCLTNLAIIEMHALRRIGKGSKLQKWLTNLFRGVSILLLPVAMTMPSCVTLYWLSSSLIGLCQNVILQLPRIRRFLRIPVTPSEPATPFRDMVQNIKRKGK